MDRQRLQRIRNYQSRDWYPAIVVRPLCIAVMWLVADWRFITPTAVTHLGNLAKVAAVALILHDTPDGALAAAALLQVGLLLDHLDGTLARYRGICTSFGAFYDKASDAFTWLAVVMAIGWVAYHRDSDPIMLVLACVATNGLLIQGYMKWIAHAEEQNLDWHRAVHDPDAVIRKHVMRSRRDLPPTRSARDWLWWFARSMAQIARFEEADLFFWTGLALLCDRLELLLWGMAVTQAAQALYMLTRHSRDMRRVDATMSQLRE